MMRLSVLSLVLALSACSSTYDDSDLPETYEAYYDVRDHGTLDTAPPSGRGLQFAPYCRTEGRFLSNWQGSRLEAASVASEHRSKESADWHDVTTVWRQPALPEGVRMDVAGGAAHEDIHDDIPVRPRRSIINSPRR